MAHPRFHAISVKYFDFAETNYAKKRLYIQKALLKTYY